MDELAMSESRFATFRRQYRHLRKTTQASYWLACLAVRRCRDLPITQMDRFLAKRLQAAARAEERIFVARPMHRRHFRLAMSEALAGDPMALLTALSYALGQRVSDMAQLARRDLKIRRWGRAERATLCITVRRGKVVPMIGAYTLHLAAASPLAHALLQRARHCRTFLFSEQNTQRQRTAIATELRLYLTSLAPWLQARSVRRGGLMRMASEGVPLESIRRLFSKHSTEAMLMAYLAAGATSLHQARNQVSIMAPLFDYPRQCYRAGGRQRPQRTRPP